MSTFQGGILDIYSATLFFIKFALLLVQCVLVHFVEPRTDRPAVYTISEKSPLLANEQKTAVNKQVYKVDRRLNKTICMYIMIQSQEKSPQLCNS